jgi:hypothetical protein
MKHVGTATVPEGTCGFSDTPTSTPCGRPATSRGLVKDTWEGESTVTACDLHHGALAFVADAVWAYDEDVEATP